jgi:nucleotide-binding universal stress UspA family protein
MFTKILVAADGSDHAFAALRAGCDLAQKYDASLHVVHVPEMAVNAIAVGAAFVEIPTSDEDILETGKPVADKVRKDAETFGVSSASVDILRGDPAETMLAYAAKNDIDLIVSGRRGLGRLTGLLLGSVSQKLAAHAPCPVLTVNPGGSHA